MSQFTERVRSRVDKSGHALTKVIEPHPHQMIKTVSGQTINLKSSQIMTLHQQASSFRQQATGNFQNILTSGGSIDIPLRENSGHGHVKNIRLKMDISNGTGGDVRLMPIPMVLERIDIITPSGTRVEQLYEEFLWLDTKLFGSKQWKYNSKYYNSDKTWSVSDDIIPNGATRSYFIEPKGNWIENTNAFLPHIDGEVIFRVYFRSDTQTLLSGVSAGLNVTKLELEYDSPFMLQSEFAQALNKHRSVVHDHRYYFPIRQQYTQNIGPSDQIDILLSGFNGTFRDFGFFIRVANAQLRDKLEYLPIDRFELLDTNGQDIFGGNYQYDEEDILDYAEHYDNDMRRHLNFYNYDFSGAPVADGLHGSLHGYYPLSGRETLRIFMKAAVQNKVLTLASGGAPLAGQYRYRYGEEYTDWLAFGALPAVQQTAINALPTFYRTNTTVVVSAAINNAVTITFSGQRLQKDEPEAVLIIEGGNAFDEDFDVAVSTSFIEGSEPSAQYEVILLGHQLHILRLTPDGQIVIKST